MDAIDLILTIVIVISAFLTIIGLIRPSFSVWWTTDNSRVQVIKVWGAITVVAAVLYFIYGAFARDNIKDDNRSTQLKTEQVLNA
jgi:formate hydrogenlyase subunit 3/multisubunit Na+/H+ antiporter MnhD subunit